MERAQGVGLRRVDRQVVADADMRLRAQVVHFLGHDLAEKVRKDRAVRQIAVVQKQPGILQVGIGIQMLDPRRVETAGAANQPVDLVTLGQKQLGQVTAVLAGNAS